MKQEDFEPYAFKRIPLSPEAIGAAKALADDIERDGVDAPTEDEQARQALTELAFKALDTLNEEAPEAKLGDALLLFEVLTPEDDTQKTTVWQESTSKRAVVNAGIASYGLEINTAGSHVSERDEE